MSKGSSVDFFEALDLKSYLCLSCAASRIALYQLGNREWCLRTIADGGAWFIWDYADARDFLQFQEDRGLVMDAKRRATEAGKHRERVSV